jgi:hypothetical protein
MFRFGILCEEQVQVAHYGPNLFLQYYVARVNNITFRENLFRQSRVFLCMQVDGGSDTFSEI